jgi:hypothetical protein
MDPAQVGTDLSMNGKRDEEPDSEYIRERLRRRAIFLRELAEARELRRRVAPRRSRRAEIRATLRARTFRND